MRRFITICLLVAFITTFFPMPEAKAIDPVTLAILAPIAVKVAERSAPYVYRGIYNAGRCLFKMGKDVFEFFLVPYGLGYMCFGSFRRGLVYTIRGGIAPGKLIVHTLLLPVMLFGVNINI
ncbi:MAG: hypothetical protein HPZ91_13910 [Lentisphaeria bacterium]|nr:hypothetical protein [Lentisphaeria bacterium]